MTKPRTIDEYLGSLPDEMRAVLEKVRETIRAVAPDVTETISYRMPAFKLDGRSLVWMAAFKDHCSLFPATERVLAAHGEELEPYFSGKGTLRFTPDKPIPPRLVKKIVKTRIEENAERRPR